MKKVVIILSGFLVVSLSACNMQLVDVFGIVQTVARLLGIAYLILYIISYRRTPTNCEDEICYEQSGESKDSLSKKEKTIKEVIDSMTEGQKNAMYTLIVAALESGPGA